MTQTPILFLIFNRPDTTKKVFETIRKNKPTHLYIAADGPRSYKAGEMEKCKITRQLTEKIDWQCNVERLYRDENLGCKKAVSSAIDWFFENEDQGIILEDDCLPHNDFFKYAGILLKRYKDDQKIFSISGDNFIPHSDKVLNESYYFTKYPHCWGWATWKRAWDKYDVEMKSWRKTKNSENFRSIFSSKLEYYYWRFLLDRLYKGKIDTWDYQWAYTLFVNGGLSINPKSNLVENIGFGKDSTHTKLHNFGDKRTSIEFPLRHPQQIAINAKLDSYTRKKVFLINPIYTMYQLVMSVVNK